MTPEEALEIKGKMESRMKSLKVDILGLKELTKPIEPSNTIGRLSRMDAINNKSVAENTLRSHQSDLKDLEFSLAKYGTADFGKCINCDREIKVARLRFLPSSIKCMRCAR